MDGSGSVCIRGQQALDYWKDQGQVLAIYRGVHDFRRVGGMGQQSG
jgi:hypothetical protein